MQLAAALQMFAEPQNTLWALCFAQAISVPMPDP